MHKRPRSCWGKCVLAEFFFSEQRCFCRSAVLPETDLIHDCPNMASTDLRCNPFNFSASLTTSIVLPSRLPFKFASKLRKILCLHLQLCQPEYLRDIVYSSCLGLALSFYVARRIYLHRKCGTGWARQACMQTLTLQSMWLFCAFLRLRQRADVWGHGCCLSHCGGAVGRTAPWPRLVLISSWAH